MSNKFLQIRMWDGVYVLPVESKLPAGAFITAILREESDRLVTIYEPQFRDRLVILHEVPDYAYYILGGHPVKDIDPPGRLVAIIKDDDRMIYMVDEELSVRVEEAMRTETVDEDTVSGQIWAAVITGGGRWEQPLRNIWSTT